jgi:hypothetical protein
VSLADPWLNRGKPLNNLLAFCRVVANVYAAHTIGGAKV